jgi:signal peptidase I
MDETTHRFSLGRVLRAFVFEFLGAVLPTVFLVLFVNVFVAQAMVVEGPSMQPTLASYQRVIVEKVTYRFFHGPRRGDVVIIDMPNEEKPLIKRVLALPGETVALREGQVFINDHLLREPWATRWGGPDFPETKVPPLHVFVLGDNRAQSRDSRYFGAVSLDQIVGHAWLRYWPLDQLHRIQ